MITIQKVMLLEICAAHKWSLRNQFELIRAL